jgi:SAM-dependent methyltransferase
MSRSDVSIVVDIGAGRRWHFPARVKADLLEKLIGVDIDESEMSGNALLDEKVVADVVDGIPLVQSSVDLITVRAGVEHFSDNEAFLRNCAACLRPGGYLVATFANKYSPFAIINQALPARLSGRILKVLVPGSEGTLGFRAYYDHSSYSGFERALVSNGFEVDYYYPSYFSSAYFAFFVPLYVLSVGFDVVRFVLGSRNLASYHLFVARKK